MYCSFIALFKILYFYVCHNQLAILQPARYPVPKLYTLLLTAPRVAAVQTERRPLSRPPIRQPRPLNAPRPTDMPSPNHLWQVSLYLNALNLVKGNKCKIQMVEKRFFRPNKSNVGILT